MYKRQTEGHLIADYLGKKQVRCVVGPLLLPPAKMELWNAKPENAQTLIDAGCLVCLTACLLYTSRCV